MASSARIEFDRGKLILHSEGPWQELTEYEFLHLFASCCDAGRALAMHKVYPPATDFSGVAFPEEPPLP